MIIRHIPNFITSLRIAGTIFLLFTRPFSATFFVVYTLCGLTDILDGFLARKYHVSSELGAKLDSIADILFYAVMAFKILPALCRVLPMAIWYGVGVVVLLRIFSYLIAAIKFKRFASHHTYMNKVTGFFVFAIPYFIRETFAIPYCTVGCIVSGIATVEELLMHILCREYRSDMKTLFFKRTEEDREMESAQSETVRQ